MFACKLRIIRVRFYPKPMEINRENPTCKFYVAENYYIQSGKFIQLLTPSVACARDDEPWEKGFANTSSFTAFIDHFDL